MADRKNQHFVPQFYFRNFSDNDRNISLLFTEDGRVVDAAPIKGQCAGDNFYGSKQLETLFSQMEAKHSQSLRAAIEIAWNKRREFFTPKEYAELWRAIVFQRRRTLLEIEKHAPAQSEMLLEMFRHHLLHSPDVKNGAKLAAAIDEGMVTVSEPPQATIARSIGVAVNSGILISDLDLLLLRNRTDYPFIFGDAPVVFYNTYARDVTNRGVLGLQCPGLQIFYPLDPATCLVMYDPEKYTGPFGERFTLDLHQRSDVSSLNALQMFHSSRAVYFGPTVFKEYVVELWQAHRHTLTKPRSKFVRNADFLVDGARPDGELMHTFEPQLGYDLRLSFFECDRVAEEDYVFARRSPEIAAQFNEAMAELDGT